MLGTIRIDPGMNLHSTLMTLLNHPLQRIPIRRWSLALDTGEELAPRFKITLIKGITFGTYLEDDGIHAILLQFVKLLVSIDWIC